VLANLWEALDDGWQIHDYLKHNRSADEVGRIKKDRGQHGDLGGRPPAPVPDEGYVVLDDVPNKPGIYALQAGAHIKIGSTETLRRRIKTQLTVPGVEFVRAFAISPALRIEQCLHEKFARAKVSTEWYSASAVKPYLLAACNQTLLGLLTTKSVNPSGDVTVAVVAADAVVVSEGSSRETFVADAALSDLQTDYPQNRVTFGYRTETAFIQQLNAEESAAAAYRVMRTNLENHKRSYEWRVKGMVPALEKWLHEGLWKRTLPEDAPAAEQVTAKTARTLQAAAGIMREAK